jgi:ubiquinone/menaquinone biosynthesis C-methylase UbiE
MAPGVSARWVRGWGDGLPFLSDAFDMVTSLEVLEFTPRPRAVLKEMVRVLTPGGWLLVTNRVGWQSRWILGKTVPRAAIRRRLGRLGLEEIEVAIWQLDYDLVWARKAVPARAN